jgi:hypothetical protein
MPRATAYRGRRWWQKESRRVGSDWNGLMNLRASIAPFVCEICGRAPCPSFSFCWQCREADRRVDRRPRIAEPWPTPQTTIEAILHCVRKRGPGALEEPENIARLSTCDEAALAEIDRRIAKLKDTAK